MCLYSPGGRYDASLLMYKDSGVPQPRRGYMRIWLWQTLWTKG